MICLTLFWNFLIIGLFTMGGGYAALPLIYERCVTENGWLTAAEYAELLSLSEITPGPIAINSATFVGTRVAGIPGALAATFGFMLIPFLIVSLLYALYRKYRSVSLMQGILGTVRPVIVALIASAGLTVLLTALFGSTAISGASVDVLSIVLFAVGFFLRRKGKCGPIAVILGCGGAALLAELLGL